MTLVTHCRILRLNDISDNRRDGFIVSNLKDLIMEHKYRTYSFLLLVLMSQSCLFAQNHIHGPQSNSKTRTDVASARNSTNPEKPVFDDGAAEMAKMIAEGEAILTARALELEASYFQDEAPEFDDGAAGMAAMIAEGERILAERDK